MCSSDLATVMQRNDIQSNSVKTHGIDVSWFTSTPGESQIATVQRFMRERLPYVKDLILTAVDGQ